MPPRWYPIPSVSDPGSLSCSQRTQAAVKPLLVGVSVVGQNVRSAALTRVPAPHSGRLVGFLVGGVGAAFVLSAAQAAQHSPSSYIEVTDARNVALNLLRPELLITAGPGDEPGHQVLVFAMGGT